MQNVYASRLITILLTCLPFAGLAQSSKETPPTASPNQTDCAPLGQFTINGPDVLAGTSLYYLTPDPSQNTGQVGNITWSVSPASAFTIYGSTTSSTLLVSAAAGCSSSTSTGIISVTLPVLNCTSVVMATFQKTVTVRSGGGVPVVRGTYSCITCADQSSRPLLLDGNTNNVTRYGTYRIDLTSSSPQDTFLAWDKYETAGATLRMVDGTTNHSGLIDLMPNASLAALAANVTNACGAKQQQFRFSGVNATGFVVVSPNPTSDELLLQEQGVADNQPASSSYRAVLYNDQGVPVRTIEAGHGKTKMDVRTLPGGIYSLRTTTDGYTENERIVITR
jgi:hypothetical protein